MFRALWSVLVACLWFRQRTALNRSARSFNAWESFVSKCVGTRPQPKESIEAHVKHAMAQAKADDMANVAAKDKLRFAGRFKAYTRAANFLPRWAWAYVPYAEIVGVGIGVGYLAHNKPMILRDILHGGVEIAASAWRCVDVASNFIADNPTKYGAAGIGAVAAVALGMSVRAIWSGRARTA